MQKTKIALFGGTFNPLHKGHIELAIEVRKKFFMDKIIFIPSKIPPHKNQDEIISADMRYLILKKSLQKYKYFEVSKQEIDRGGISYSIDTIKKMLHTQEASFYFILGLDAFLEIDSWQLYQELFLLIPFIIIKRHNKDKKINIEEYIHNKISPSYCFSKEKSAFLHNTKKTIYITDLNIREISSSFIRQKINENENVEDFMPIEAIKIIKTFKLYETFE